MYLYYHPSGIEPRNFILLLIKNQLIAHIYRICKIIIHFLKRTDEICKSDSTTEIKNNNLQIG